jgi:hypothetical protein
MGLIWDLIQQGQIEQRVAHLEQELRRTNDARALERRFGEDLDGDSRVG